jgi:hypothetical protein
MSSGYCEFEDNMKSIKKLTVGGRLIWISFLMGSSFPANAQTNDASLEADLNIIQWQMIWLGDLGRSELKAPFDGLATQRQDFIRTVYIQTEMINGELVTTRASANCNNPTRVARTVVATPARSIATYRFGKRIYKNVPATYKTVVEYVMTHVGCSVLHEQDGKTFELAWPNAIEGFMLGQMKNAIHSRKGNELEWLDETGKVLARFEKHLEVTW